MLIPIRTDRPRIRPAYLTCGLIAVCVLVHLCSLGLPEVEVREVAAGEEIVTLWPPLLFHHGLWGSRPTPAAFLTHLFLHGDLLHLASNMLFLWVFGSLIEDVLRPWRMAALYLAGGVLAALTHVGVTLALGAGADGPLVGASGAVAAVMGFFMLRFFKTRVRMLCVCALFWVRSVWALLLWISLEIARGLLDPGGGVAHWAHVGGFFAGVLAAPFLGSVSAARQEYLTDDPETNVEYVRRGELVAEAEKALRAEPGNAYRMRRLAQACRHAGEYQRASAVYQQCIARFADRGLLEQAAAAHQELAEHDETAVPPAGVLLKLAGHLEQAAVPRAAAAYRQLLARHGAEPEAEYALLRLSVLCTRALHRPEEGRRHLEEFLRRYPHSRWGPQARQALAELERGLRRGPAGIADA